MLGNPTKRHPSIHPTYDLTLSLDNIIQYNTARDRFSLLGIESVTDWAGAAPPTIPQSTNGSPKFRGTCLVYWLFSFSLLDTDRQRDSLYLDCVRYVVQLNNTWANVLYVHPTSFVTENISKFFLEGNLKIKFLFKNRSVPSYRMFTHTQKVLFSGYKYTHTNRCEVSP